MMMRGVQSVGAFLGEGWRLEAGRLCDDDGCDLSIGSSQSTPVYQCGKRVPQVSVPVQPSPAPSLAAVCPVCRSCPLSPAVWLPCYTTFPGTYCT